MNIAKDDERNNTYSNCSVDLEQFKGIKFIVAKRLLNIKNSDIIIFIIEGEVSSIGKYDDLLKNNPRYRKLYEENNLQ